jgi:hypothetical protein
MKKFLMIAVLVSLLLMTATTAFAAGNRPLERGRSPFALTGKITAIDGATVTIKVAAGNRLVKAYLGKETPVLTTATTIYLQRNPDGTATRLTIADLAVGQNVSVSGRVTVSGLQANRITVGAQLLHLP